MNKKANATDYETRYRMDHRLHRYPTEFVVRAFLGSYPDFRMPRADYRGRRALDLGYGDGRNLAFLHDLGMRVYGVEVSDAIHRHVTRRLKKIRVKADLATGSNSSIPFQQAFFSFILSCHTSYYVKQGETFADNLAEIARVMAPDGIWVASLPMKGGYLLKGARVLGEGHVEIRRDPYGLRKGMIFRVFGSKNDIQRTLRPFFDDVRIGFCDDDYWGIRQKVWIVVARRRK